MYSNKENWFHLLKAYEKKHEKKILEPPNFNLNVYKIQLPYCCHYEFITKTKDEYMYEVEVI